MTVDRKTALHICKVVARQIQVGYPDLTLTFIVHEEHKRQKALVRDTENIQEHPAGQILLDYVLNSKDKEITGNRSKFVGLAQYNNPGILGFFRSTATMALFFVNCDRFKSQEDLKNHTLHMAWHALALYDDYTMALKRLHEKSGTVPLPGQKPASPRKKTSTEQAAPEHKAENAPETRIEIVDGVAVTKLETQDLYHRNLLADIFSAAFQALHGTENAIRSLAVQRMHDTLTPQIGFISEKYPYPISMETLEMLFSEKMQASGKREKGISLATSITREIGMTYKINAIKQWRAFCSPAQEMAWCGFDPQTILGAAIYTNENTYVRSIADMVSEHLEIKPKIFSTLNDYNPFADQDINKRLHEKSAAESFRTAMEKIRTPDNHKIFLNEAYAHCQKLRSGNAIGWAAHALLAVSEEIMLCDPKTLNHQKTRFQNLYEQQLQRVSWENLRSFSRFIFRQRRDGLEVTPQLIESIPGRTEDIVIIKDTFARLDEMFKTIAQADNSKAANEANESGSFSRFVSPNALK